ncbi:hypothetical protein U5A82_18690 [Sphingobium sp. CR2-8]|uniref:hypothetical protein n=1 Tax=Sphingobium sp. CR2-8 TaxID=1306534 RepID=UPI002DB73D97|nr:hypothetical protein [Sphingobium sp. CR2-8]MEC3912427.1 hypothetical protein [Sphingobium sp. CR2-8]
MARDWAPACLLLIVGLAGLGIGWIASAKDSGQYLVVASPGSTLADMMTMIRAADGGLVAPGRFANIVIAGSDRTNFPADLRKAGAWLAIATPARNGCTAPLSQESPS